MDIFFCEGISSESFELILATPFFLITKYGPLACSSKTSIDPMDKSQEVVAFLSDPATLVALGIVTAGAIYYMSRHRNIGQADDGEDDLDKQSYDLPVRYLFKLK